jgi:hypothetical protein
MSAMKPRMWPRCYPAPESIPQSLFHIGGGLWAKKELCTNIFIIVVHPPTRQASNSIIKYPADSTKRSCYLHHFIKIDLVWEFITCVSKLARLILSLTTIVITSTEKKIDAHPSTSSVSCFRLCSCAPCHQACCMWSNCTTNRGSRGPPFAGVNWFR